MDFLKSKNTLNLLYNYDKENNTTNIFFELKQDGKTFTVSQNANVIVNYYSLTDGKSNLWQVQRDETGRLYSNVKDFKDINNAGKYSVVVNVDGTMFPSQGQTIFNIEEKTTPIGTHLIVLKGDAGKSGEDGVSVKNITIDENGNITTTLSDDTVQTGRITLPDKLKGTDGKDAPSITGVHFNEGQTELIFDMSDSSKHIATFTPPKNGVDGKDGKNAAEFTGVSLTPDNYLKFTKSDNTSLEFKMPNLKGEKGDKGDPGEPGATGPAGQAGKDAPTISNVIFSNNSLTFNLSDGTKQSVVIPTIQGIQGPAGENGKDGKDAAKITGAKFNADQTQIIFNLSDGTSFTTNFIPPKNGVNGKDGKDAPNFTNVEYSNNSLIFTLSDGKTITATLPDLRGKDGTPGKDGAPGKDAPTITGAKVENNKLTFTFSDGTSQSADLPNLEGKSITDVKLNGTILVFTLSDNSKFGVSLRSITNFDTYADAGIQILQNPSSSPKPSDGVNAIISPVNPTLWLNYKNNPLKLTYDKNFKTLGLTTDTTGNLQSYKIDFSPIFDVIENGNQQKLNDITFSANPQKVVLKPNSDQNYLDVDFDVNKNKNGKIIKGNMHKQLIFDTTQLTTGGTTSNDNKIKFYDLFVKGPKSGKYMVNEDIIKNGSMPSIVLTNYTIIWGNRNDTNNTCDYMFIAKILPIIKDNTIYLPNDQGNNGTYTGTLARTDFVNSFTFNMELDDLWTRALDNYSLNLLQMHTNDNDAWNNSIDRNRYFPKDYIRVQNGYLITFRSGTTDQLTTFKNDNFKIYPEVSNNFLTLTFFVNKDVA